jgi:hypothetical protein
MMAYPESRYISIIDKIRDKQGVLKRHHNNISRNRFGGKKNRTFSFWWKRKSSFLAETMTTRTQYPLTT